MRSLRTALILGTTIGIASVLAAAGALLYTLLRSDLEGQFDRSLLDSAQLLASTMEQGPRKVDRDLRKYDMREFEASVRPGYLELWLSDGSVFFRSPSLGKSDLKPHMGQIEAPVFRSLQLPDGRAGRSVGITFVPRVGKKKREADALEASPEPPRTVTLVLARGTESIAATLTRLASLFAIVGLAALAVSTGVLWFVIWRSLRPVHHVAAQIGELGEHDLSARIDARGAPKELQPVTGRLNELLCRLEAAFERERALSADVAHELRTPLAGLRSTMDVVLSRPRDSGQYQEALGQCLQITMQMEDMVENLLSLARLEAGKIESKPEIVCPNELLRAAWKPFAEPAEARRLRLAWALGPRSQVVTDPALLSLVLRNVLENAVAHADEGGSVTIETQSKEQEMDIHVRNSGSTLSQEEAEHVFERFWRGDASRSAAGNHCGLGLALVKKTVAVLGGSVAVQSTPGGEFGITVCIPG